VANHKFTPKPAASGDHINLQDENEMRMWIKAFGIPREKLEAAVLAAGTDALKVRLYLARQTS
jgi:hypothetical protein